MKTFIIVVISVLFFFVFLVAIGSSASGVKSEGPPSGSGRISSCVNSEDPSISLSKIADMEDNEDRDFARLRFTEHIAMLSSNVIENPSRISDIIYNTKNILKGKGINQTLLECSSDLSRIYGSQRFELANAAVEYCTARIVFNENRESAIQSASAIVRNHIEIHPRPNRGRPAILNGTTATNSFAIKEDVIPTDSTSSEIVIEKSMRVNTRFTNKNVNVIVTYTELVGGTQSEEKLINALRSDLENSVYDSYVQAEINLMKKINSDKIYMFHIKSILIKAPGK